MKGRGRPNGQSAGYGTLGGTDYSVGVSGGYKAPIQFLDTVSNYFGVAMDMKTD